MGSKEDAGKGCPAAGGVSSFTIQSILGGGPSEVPREPAGWPARKRSLSVSSEEEEPDDGWKAPACFCPDPHGPKEPGPKHHPPIPFPCLGKDRTPPGRPRASSTGGKLCRGAGPLWPEPRPPGVQGGGEGTRGRCCLLLPEGAREVTGTVLDEAGLEGAYTTAGRYGAGRTRGSALNIPFVHRSDTFRTRGLEVGSQRSVCLYRNLFQLLFSPRFLSPPPLGLITTPR